MGGGLRWGAGGRLMAAPVFGLCCLDLPLGLLWTVWGWVCVENLDHRPGGGEGLCYRWKTLVPGWQTGEGQITMGQGWAQSQKLGGRTQLRSASYLLRFIQDFAILLKPSGLGVVMASKSTSWNDWVQSSHHLNKMDRLLSIMAADLESFLLGIEKDLFREATIRTSGV